MVWFGLMLIRVLNILKLLIFRIINNLIKTSKHNFIYLTFKRKEKTQLTIK